MIVVSACLPSDALLQYLPSYLGFSYLGPGVSLHGCSSKSQLLLLTLDEVAPPELKRPKVRVVTESTRMRRCRSSREELPHV